MFDFVRRPPVHVGDLAAALGVRVSDLAPDGGYGMGMILATVRTSAAVTGVSADYDWDLYHDNPVTALDDLAERRLARYSVRFAAGRPACEAELSAGYGPPVAVAGRRRYGPFYVDDGSAGQFTLEWFGTTPVWALPPVDAQARVRAVEQLAARVRNASSQPELAAALAGIPAGLGITASGTEVRFQPPVPAADLACAFGWPGAVGQTVDVHMSTWLLVTVVGDRTGRPRLGRWRTDAGLAGRASGGDVPGVHAPAALVAFLGAGDVVGWVSFTGS